MSAFFLRAAWQHERITYHESPEYPEPPAIKPENRNLLQFPRELDRLLLMHDHRDAALAVRSIWRARVNLHEPVPFGREPRIQLAPTLLVLSRRKIPPARIERSQYRERLAESGRGQIRQRLLRRNLPQIDFHRRRGRKAEDCFRIPRPIRIVLFGR